MLQLCCFIFYAIHDALSPEVSVDLSASEGVIVGIMGEYSFSNWILFEMVGVETNIDDLI